MVLANSFEDLSWIIWDPQDGREVPTLANSIYAHTLAIMTTKTIKTKPNWSLPVVWTIVLMALRRLPCSLCLVPIRGGQSKELLKLSRKKCESPKKSLAHTSQYCPGVVR